MWLIFTPDGRLLKRIFGCMDGENSYEYVCRERHAIYVWMPVKLGLLFASSSSGGLTRNQEGLFVVPNGVVDMSFPGFLVVCHFSCQDVSLPWRERERLIHSIQVMCNFVLASWFTLAIEFVFQLQECKFSLLPVDRQMSLEKSVHVRSSVWVYVVVQLKRPPSANILGGLNNSVHC